ncbi:MAG: hypothetical protein Q8R83_06040 [Legionellaceae bacterium]|nr:hypothetical protein [Legionellaceae bacterium]
MTIDQKYERELVKLQADLDARIARFYTILAQEVAPLIASGMERRALERAINAKLSQITKSLRAQIESSVSKAWYLSNKKTVAYLDKRLKGFDLPDSITKVWIDPNEKAFREFLKHKDSGVTLSKRVFKQTKQAKKILTDRIKAGIGEGKSSVKIARDLRDQLVNPTGSESPGRGVYKSPQKNTQRLARTITNKSYRLADQEAWEKNPTILGYEIQLSKTQSKKVKARCEICRALAGKYPVSFVFVGWHPHCLCYKTPILMNEKQMAAYTKLIAEGKDTPEAIQKVRAMKGGGLVEDVPDGFKNWVSNNTERVRGWSSQPSWVQNNFKDGDIGSGLKNIKSKPVKVKSFIPAGLDSYEKRTGIKVNREIFQYLDKDTPMVNRGTGAFYESADNYINLPIDERRMQSKWKAESVVYHEYGHAADWQRGLKFRPEVKETMGKYRAAYDGRLADLSKKTWDIGFPAFQSGDYDIAEQAQAVADTIMSLDLRYGYGHDQEYFARPGFSEAEFIAHAFENRFSGNEIFKELMPDLYEDMIKLIRRLK